MYVTFQLDDEDKTRIQTQTDTHLKSKSTHAPDAFAIAKAEFATQRQNIINEEVDKINKSDHAGKTDAYHNRRAIVDAIIVKINASVDERIRSLGGEDPSESMAQYAGAEADASDQTKTRAQKVAGSKSRFTTMFVIVILTFLAITALPQAFRWWWLMMHKSNAPHDKKDEDATEMAIRRLLQVFSVDTVTQTPLRAVSRFVFLVAAIVGLEVLVFWSVSSQYFCDEGYTFSFRLWRQRVLRGAHGIGIVLVYVVCGILLLASYSSAQVQGWICDVYHEYVGGAYSAAVSIPVVTGLILLTMVSMNVFIQNAYVDSKRERFVDSDGFIESSAEGRDERMAMYGCERRRQRP